MNAAQTPGRNAPAILVELMPDQKSLIRAHALYLHPQLERQLRDGR
jgi:hypothetical protein